MKKPDIIRTVLKDSKYSLPLFKDDEIDRLREKVFTKTARGKDTPFVHCIVRGKDIQLKPEEIVRQLYAARLINKYNYPTKRLASSIRFLLAEKRRALILSFSTKTAPIPHTLSLS